jgi:glutamine amidotransferase-like uncharacterized protein
MGRIASRRPLATAFVTLIAGLHAALAAAQEVAVYDDTALPGGGSWAAGLAALRSLLDETGLAHGTVDPAAVGDGGLDGYEMLLVGGGWAGGYRRYLSPAALDEIREFVAAGGVYVGICAGAYLAADRVLWRPDTASPRERYDYPLDLFDGAARGPVLSLKAWTDPTGCPRGITAGARMTAMTTALGSEVPVLYYGGPLFSGLGGIPGLEVLARYAAPGTDADGAPAVIRFPWGEGWVVLVSPHAELAFDDCRYRFLAAPRTFLGDVIVSTLERAANGG